MLEIGNKGVEPGFLMNAKTEFQYSDPTLSDKTKEKHILSILVDRDGFLFYVYQPSNRLLLHFEKRMLPPSKWMADFLDILKNLVREVTESGYKLQEIKLMQPSNRVTLVPSAIFDKEKMSRIFYLNFEDNKNEKIHHYTVSQHQLEVLFPVPAYLETLIDHFTTPLRFYNQALPLFEYSKTQTDERGMQLYITLMTEQADYVLIKDRNLEYYNSFQYKNETDFVYYTLNILKQLNIDKKELHVNLIGLPTKNDKRIAQLHHFIDHMFFVKELNLKHNFSVDNTLLYQNLNFLNLHLCE